MILFNGEIINTKAINLEEKYIDSLYDRCVETLNQPVQITRGQVIGACDRLYHRVMAGEFNEYIWPLLTVADISYERFREMAELFSREELEYKCRVELGEWTEPLADLKCGISRRVCPLGILLHIAAGNVDGLPAYSVIEGLLAGNINILKLPAGDSGFSVKLLSELVKEEPALAEYIYVFDVPSTETATLRKLAEVADAVVVWGGDEAVNAARHLTDEKTKVIAWGHKLSFAYVTEAVTDEELYGLARHVCETNQVLCSSCQGIYVGTRSPEVVAQTGQRFFEQLKKANAACGKADPGMRGRNSIRIYNDLLEAEEGQTILNDEGVSVHIKSDSRLEISYLFRNVWVKGLPSENIITELKKHKGHLQSCALLCAEEERPLLAELLVKAGLVRITGADMSASESGGAHDGMYPLREYSRIVETGQ
ncbi:MAG: acyl-CoA reductase [Firmicutes bacterium]|nr:acyl-CoA reductase [Bacillota bacterium]